MSGPGARIIGQVADADGLTVDVGADHGTGMPVYLTRDGGYSPEPDGGAS
jgi:hypothetical protein